MGDSSVAHIPTEWCDAAVNFNLPSPFSPFPSHSGSYELSMHLCSFSVFVFAVPSLSLCGMFVMTKMSWVCKAWPLEQHFLIAVESAA